MDIQFELNGNKGRFYIQDGNESLAEMTFTMAGPDKMIIDHTEVGDQLKGTGAGKKLVASAVEYAREKNIKILPLCPFAKAVMEKTPEYSDVLF